MVIIKRMGSEVDKRSFPSISLSLPVATAIWSSGMFNVFNKKFFTSSTLIVLSVLLSCCDWISTMGRIYSLVDSSSLIAIISNSFCFSTADFNVFCHSGIAINSIGILIISSALSSAAETESKTLLLSLPFVLGVAVYSITHDGFNLLITSKVSSVLALCASSIMKIGLLRCTTFAREWTGLLVPSIFARFSIWKDFKFSKCEDKLPLFSYTFLPSVLSTRQEAKVEIIIVVFDWSVPFEMLLASSTFNTSTLSLKYWFRAILYGWWVLERAS